MGRTRLLFLFFSLCPSLVWSDSVPIEINSILMESTFLIVGPSKDQPGKSSFGTVFILAEPTGSNKGVAVMVTAAHVLNNISGNVATVFVRYKSTGGQFSTNARPLPIRKNGLNLYQTHANADVAAMVFPLAPNLTDSPIPTTWLTDDEKLKQLEVHPGDYLLSLGFPEGASTEAAFPFLRTGVIASYPLFPTQTVKSWSYDVHVYPGNSGGPVYYHFENRFHGGAFHAGEITSGIVGLISERVFPPTGSDSQEPLSIAVIVPAVFVLQTIEMLHIPKATEAKP